MRSVDVLRPRWTSAAFLLYAGGLTVLGAAVWSLQFLADAYGPPGFVGWSALVLVVLAAVAALFRRAGRRVAAGVFAVGSVVAFAVFVGALENWFGWLPEDEEASLFQGFRLGLLLLELLTLTAALVALRLFRFPLLMALAAAAAWYFVTDLLSGGGNWSAVLTFLIGLAFLGLGLAVDGGERRPYGFWLHVAAGLTIGGSLLFFWHTSDSNWALIAVAGVAYVGLAAALARSSWAVLGAVGLFLAAAHFAQKWAVVVPFFGDPFERRAHPWSAPLVFAVLGFLLVVLGLPLERWRRAQPPDVRA